MNETITQSDAWTRIAWAVAGNMWFTIALAIMVVMVGVVEVRYVQFRKEQIDFEAWRRQWMDNGADHINA